MENSAKISIVEALILASPEPIPARKLADMVRGLTPSGAGKAVAELNNRYMETGCSFRVRELAGGFQFYIVPEFAGYVQELFARRRKMRLTRASLETMAIIAYKQPVTKAEIEHVRGVATDGVVHHLLEKKLITIQGRAKTVGKPLQYGTTNEFLKFFGLASLGDLPKMSEIEELIAENEPRSQTQLELAQPTGEEQSVPKLNVADGTYDPVSDEIDESQAEQTADSADGSIVQEAEPVVEEAPVESADTVVESDSGLDDGNDITEETEDIQEIDDTMADGNEVDESETASRLLEPEEDDAVVNEESPLSVDNDEMDDAREEPAAPVIVDMDSNG